MSRWTLLLATALLPAACVGTIGDDGRPSPGSQDNEPASLEPPDCADMGPRMIRRLTNEQLHRTMVDLFDDPSVPVTDVLTDPVVHGFAVDATEAVIRDLNAQQLMVQAERVAEWAVANKLGQISPCQTADDACLRDFVTSFGRRVYRQEVPSGSVDDYVAMGKEEADFPAAAEAILATMLQSPYLLYRQERGQATGDGGFELTPDEVATNLAYTFTDAPPDDALLAAAAEGRLATAEDLERETKRLVQSAAADGPLGHFVAGWLEVEDLESRNKQDPTMQYSDAISASMSAETVHFFRHVVRSGGDFAELMTASYTFVDQPLAGYYGLAGPGGDAMQQTDTTYSSRPRGLLGQGAFLARHALADASSPVQRGVVVRERFLCDELPSPPATVDTDIPQASEPTTTRARYEEHLTDASCASCHQLIDPIGFAFEHWDAFGRFRDQENGYPIDASGEVSGTPDGDVPLDGVDSLSEHLAQSEPAKACFTRYLSYFSYGLDGCNPEALAELSGADPTIEDVLLAIVKAPHFTRRRGSE